MKIEIDTESKVIQVNGQQISFELLSALSGENTDRLFRFFPRPNGHVAILQYGITAELREVGAADKISAIAMFPFREAAFRSFDGTD